MKTLNKNVDSKFCGTGDKLNGRSGAFQGVFGYPIERAGFGHHDSGIRFGFEMFGNRARITFL